MFHVKDNKQGYIFDPDEYLGPKRLTGLKNSWPEIFRQEILPALPNVCDAGLNDSSANA